MVATYTIINRQYLTHANIKTSKRLHENKWSQKTAIHFLLSVHYQLAGKQNNGIVEMHMPEELFWGAVALSTALQ